MSTELCRLFIDGRKLIVIVGVVVNLMFAEKASAVRVVDFEILVDGRVALYAHDGDEGAPAGDVWDYLFEEEFHLMEGTTVRIDPANPLRAELRSDRRENMVRIYCRYGGDVEVVTLDLLRDTPDSPTWRIHPRQIRETFVLRDKHPRYEMTSRRIRWEQFHLARLQHELNSCHPVLVWVRADSCEKCQRIERDILYTAEAANLVVLHGVVPMCIDATRLHMLSLATPSIVDTPSPWLAVFRSGQERPNVLTGELDLRALEDALGKR